jgi:inhibitor of KinA
MSPVHHFNIEPFGERGWLVRFSDFTDDIQGGLFANAAADALRKLPSITDAVAGIDSIVIRFDPAQINAETTQRNIVQTIEATATPSAMPHKHIEIPVLYGGAAGPDFDALCRDNNLSTERLIDAHAARAYRVITLGFAPGFAYLGPLDGRLRASRLATPRPRLAAGSIGVAGTFTGVYSLPSPGGWRIIGRTPLALFDAQSASPFLFEPGAEVRFQPISQSEFDRINQKST